MRLARQAQPLADLTYRRFDHRLDNKLPLHHPKTPTGQRRYRGSNASVNAPLVLGNLRKLAADRREALFAVHRTAEASD
jgi:hypothetical protein